MKYFRLKVWQRNGVLLLLLLLPPGFYNSCQRQGFDSASTEGSFSAEGNVELGKTLYSINCSSCHGDIASSNKAGRSPFAIQQAISTLSAMSHLSTLNSDQISSIATALGYDPKLVGLCKGRREADINALFRLNKQEYLYTVGDLFGAPISVAQNFPPDNDGERFANDAPSLAMILPERLEQYVYAAEAIVNFVITTNKSLIFSCTPPATAPATCAAQIIDSWGRRILRRPLLTAERTQLLAMVDQSIGVAPNVFAEGIQTAIKSLLVSPNFLFRTLSRGSSSQEINQFELATRLAFFLWSSTPDDLLLDLAQAGTLSQPGTLKAQIERMLASPKALRLASEFSLRWFGVHRLNFISPSTSAYPNFTPALKTAMIEETKLFFRHIVQNNLNPRELLTSKYTFVNESLATHYGLSGVVGTQFRQVSTSTSPRQGILSHGSVLMLTSHPDDSSIVQRGKWVLDNLLCDPPPPPPPNVMSSLTSDSTGLSKRERIEAHRNNPACFSCHSRMDPIGFGLENFDGIGAFRTSWNGQPIDNQGILPDGQKFSSAAELGSYLSEQQAYNKCVAQKLMSFAVGRALNEQDDCNVEDVAKKIAEPDSQFSDAIEAVINNAIFTRIQGK